MIEAWRMMIPMGPERAGGFAMTLAMETEMQGAEEVEADIHVGLAMLGSKWSAEIGATGFGLMQPGGTPHVGYSLTGRVAAHMC